MAILEMAMVGPLEPAVQARAVKAPRRPKPVLAELEARIGHIFADRALFARALTHVSASPSGARTETYQRLEFLGDRVLGLAVCEMLCEMFPDAAEGELSRRLAELVRKESCAEVARDWGVGPHLKLGGGESRTGGRDKAAILGDVCEALIGAVFVDGSYGEARDVVARAFSSRMLAPRRPLRDAKTMLQEWAQARRLPPPLYKQADRSGPDHAPLFTISVEVEGFAGCEAVGPSKRIAEQMAASAFMERHGVTQAIEEPVDE